MQSIRRNAKLGNAFDVMLTFDSKEQIGGTHVIMTPLLIEELKLKRGSTLVLQSRT